MPFADDVRRYRFASLDNLVSKKGESITDHTYIPTRAQLEAMDLFVDGMDLMEAGKKDEDEYIPFLYTAYQCSRPVLRAPSNLGTATRGSILYNPTTLPFTE